MERESMGVGWLVLQVVLIDMSDGACSNERERGTRGIDADFDRLLTGMNELELEAEKEELIVMRGSFRGAVCGEEEERGRVAVA